ncbi:Transportin-3 [Phytophthora boehmeriae]|uniref:Transportin-3 n=1 Tax=Phytophthora boehmeriae TaxID=109152 RepID=A0A8T1WXZ7_9STRA|nr:Transportin-3 [Phytophthora boehmeriae]
MELQTGVLVDETLKINASGVAVRACEGRGNGQVDDLDMNLLSDLLPPSGEFEAQAAAPKTIPGDASPTADSSDATESSSGNEELVMRERSVAGSGRPKRPKKSVSTSSLSSSSSSADVEMEAEVLQEGNGEIIDRKARRRAQVASSARRLRCRKKNEMMMLKTEASILEQQLEGLRLKHKQMRANGAVAAWEEMAIAQRHKRRQAEQTHEQLRHALFLQSGFMRNLKSMFSQSMPCSIELNMRNLLHTPTHLLKESSESRVRGLEAVCTEAKLDMAKRIVLDETGSITPFTTPHISCQQIDLGASCFGMTTVAVYALETKNACKTFKSVCNAVLNCAAMWPNYSLVNSSLKLVDVPPTKLNIRYGVAHQVYQSDATGDQVSVETREVSYYKWTDGRGILLWDYVDADDVHPLQKDTTAVRCTIGAVLVQPEICLDGVERMVCRNICTKVHMVDKSEVTPAIERFSKSRQLCARMCGSLVYEMIKNDAATNLQ